MAKLYVREGMYYFDDKNDGSLVECKTKELHGGTFVVLPSGNSCNRQYIRTTKATEEGFEIEVKTSAPRVLSGTPKKDPCEWAYKWLSEEKAAELKAIMDEARAAMEAAKPVKLTKAEKLQAKISKLQAELEALNDGGTEEIE